MFDTPSAGPLSPIVGLERRKFEQQNVPPGQEQMAAAAGGIPISGDLAQLIQLNRALQQRGIAQQQGNPAPSTVAQDLRQMAMQQMQQQGPQMMPQMNARQQGIANLPVGNLGVKGMAGGGIVAFNGEDESLVRDPYNFNMIQDAESRRLAEQAKAQREAQARQAAARTPSVESLIKRNAAPAGGLAELVPTLTGGAGKISDYDRILKDLQISAEHPITARAREREELEKQYGLDKIRAAREAEMARREKELSPEAQRKAFLNNLSAKLASQIGQRGVSTSSRLAQMVGAYGAAKAESADQLKKSTADLNQAKLDVQEKNAIAQMTGAMSDRKAAEDAKRQYVDAMEKKTKLDREAAQEKATADYRTGQLRQGERELDIRARTAKDEAEHRKIMQDIADNKAPLDYVKELLDSNKIKLTFATTRLKDPALMDPNERNALQSEAMTILQEIKAAENYLRGKIPGYKPTPSTGGGSVVKFGDLK